MSHENDEAVIRKLLTTPGTWAVVGLSNNQDRAAYGISKLLQQLGHRIIPIHPSAATVHGATGYPTLADVPGPVDVVDIFVNSSHAGAVVDSAIACGAGAVWMQLDVIDDAAAERAQSAGLDVVMDTCPSIERRRLGFF